MGYLKNDENENFPSRFYKKNNGNYDNYDDYDDFEVGMNIQENVSWAILSAVDHVDSEVAEDAISAEIYDATRDSIWDETNYAIRAATQDNNTIDGVYTKTWMAIRNKTNESSRYIIEDAARDTIEDINSRLGMEK